MKKLSSVLGIVVLVLLAPHGAKASAIWFAGAKAGLNWSTVTGSDISSDVGYRMQITAGGFVGVELSKYFGIRLEGFFYPKGAQVNTQTLSTGGGTPSWVDVTGTLSLSYFEFPLLAVGQLPYGDKVIFEGFAGPYYAFNVQTTFDVASSGTTLPVGIDNLIKDTDVGIVLGLGVAWDTEHFRTHFEGRYEYSLDSIDEQGFDAKNQTFAIMIGFTPIRGK